MINIIMLELSAGIKCRFFYDKEIASFYDEKGFDNVLDYGSCLLEAWSNVASRNTAIQVVLSLLG
jgi:hypothetical protein